jgi:hypothetical protein
MRWWGELIVSAPFRAISACNNILLAAYSNSYMAPLGLGDVYMQAAR